MQQYSHLVQSLPDLRGDLPATEPITRLLALETSPRTVVPLLEELRSLPTTERDRAVFYAYHLGHESAEVRHVCIERLVQELPDPEAAVPVLCSAYAREPDRELRVQIQSILAPYGSRLLFDPEHTGAQLTESARRADIRYRLVDGARPESVHSLLISIGLESSPAVHFEAFEVLGKLFPKLTPAQREASVLTCLYLLRRSEQLQSGSLTGSFYYLESMRPDSPALCEVLKSYLDHPDTYLRARAACTLMAINHGYRELCASVLVGAMLQPTPRSLPVPPTPELKKIDAAERIDTIAKFTAAQKPELAELILEEFEESVQEPLRAGIEQITRAYERSIRRLHRAFSAIDRRLTELAQGAAAAMALCRFEQFSAREQPMILHAALKLLELGSSSAHIYRPVLETLPHIQGYEQYCFNRIAKLLFSDLGEDLETHACTALGSIGGRTPELRAQTALLLRLVASGERSVYLGRHVARLLESLGAIAEER